MAVGDKVYIADKNTQDDIQTKVTDIQGDTSRIEADTQDIQTKVNDIQADTGRIETDTQDIQTKSNNIYTDTQYIRSQFPVDSGTNFGLQTPKIHSFYTSGVSISNSDYVILNVTGSGYIHDVRVYTMDGCYSAVEIDGVRMNLLGGYSGVHEAGYYSNYQTTSSYYSILATSGILRFNNSFKIITYVNGSYSNARFGSRVAYSLD